MYFQYLDTHDFLSTSVQFFCTCFQELFHNSGSENIIFRPAALMDESFTKNILCCHCMKHPDFRIALTNRRGLYCEVLLVCKCQPVMMSWFKSPQRLSPLIRFKAVLPTVNQGKGQIIR